MRKTVALVCLFNFCVAVFGCREPASPRIVIGVNPWPGYEFVSIAENKGFFKDEQLDVKIVDLHSTGDARRAFERQQIDVFAGSLIELLITNDIGTRKAKVLSVTDYSNGADKLLAKPEIKSISDLRGKRVGVEPMSLDTVAVVAALRTSNMVLSDVVLVNLPQNELPQAFLSGKLDAVEVYPPNSFTIERQAKTNKIFDSSRAPGLIVDILGVDVSLVEKQPEAIRKLLRAFHRAQMFITEHPEEAFALMAHNERISVEELRQALSGIKLLGSVDQKAFLSPNGPIGESLTNTYTALKAFNAVTAPLGPHSDYLLDEAYYE